MTGLNPLAVLKAAALAFAVSMFVGSGLAAAAITPTSNGDALADAIDDGNPPGSVTGGALTVEPPNGNPAAVSDTPLALFPLGGSSYSMLSTGNTREADDPDNSDSTSTDNGGGNAGHGAAVFDLVTLRVDLDVPANRNCLTVDYRFLTEEFEEFVNSSFNDAFLAELDGSNFVVNGDGSVNAPNNFAFGPDGQLTTVNAAGTSSDNALGTTYDGATPVLRATTPITPGSHTVHLSIYDANDAIFDSSVFVDNIRLRNVAPEECKVGSADNPLEGLTCGGKKPDVFASNGRAEGTPGDDVILGTPESEIIRGRGGNDTICGLGEADLIRGNRGNDVIRGGAGADEVEGNLGNDKLKGNRGSDTVRGQAGRDTAFGNKGTDTVAGGKARDKVHGNANNDVVRGSKGNDSVFGGIGRDSLFGGVGTDSCKGGGGKDSKRGCES